MFRASTRAREKVRCLLPRPLPQIFAQLRGLLDIVVHLHGRVALNGGQNALVRPSWMPSNSSVNSPTMRIESSPSSSRTCRSLAYRRAARRSSSTLGYVSRTNDQSSLSRALSPSRSGGTPMGVQRRREADGPAGASRRRRRPATGRSRRVRRASFSRADAARGPTPR